MLTETSGNGLLKAIALDLQIQSVHMIYVREIAHSRSGKNLKWPSCAELTTFQSEA